MLLNQYCQSTARTRCGGASGKGLPAKGLVRHGHFPEATPRSSTIGFCCHEPREANQRFQSKRADRARKARTIVQSLGLVTEGIRKPNVAVVGTLELNLITMGVS